MLKGLNKDKTGSKISGVGPNMIILNFAVKQHGLNLFTRKFSSN
jgi:hypothetical protein